MRAAQQMQLRINPIDDRGALSSEDVARAKAMVEDYYEDVVHTVSQLNLSEDLVNGGFSTFKTRDRGRFDMVVPGLAQLLEAAGAAWMPLVKALLGDDARLCHAGCITALPDCAGQKWHSDGDHVHDEMQLPAHAVNVFVPLIDSGLRQGATEFVPKTHYDWSADERPVARGVPRPRRFREILRRTIVTDARGRSSSRPTRATRSSSTGG